MRCRIQNLNFWFKIDILHQKRYEKYMDDTCLIPVNGGTMHDYYSAHRGCVGSRASFPSQSMSPQCATIVMSIVGNSLLPLTRDLGLPLLEQRRWHSLPPPCSALILPCFQGRANLFFLPTMREGERDYSLSQPWESFYSLLSIRGIMLFTLPPTCIAAASFVRPLQSEHMTLSPTAVEGDNSTLT